MSLNWNDNEPSHLKVSTQKVTSVDFLSLTLASYTEVTSVNRYLLGMLIFIRPNNK